MNKKTISNKVILSLFAFSLIATAYSCAGGYRIKTSAVQDTDVSGIFTVIYYGFNYSNDPRNVVFLDLQGDDYSFEPFTRDYQFKIIEDVHAETELSNARSFIRRNHYYSGSQLRKIMSDGGQVIGYEVRSLFPAHVFETHDILDIQYRIRENIVILFFAIHSYI